MRRARGAVHQVVQLIHALGQFGAGLDLLDHRAGDGGRHVGARGECLNLRLLLGQARAELLGRQPQLFAGLVAELGVSIAAGVGQGGKGALGVFDLAAQAGGVYRPLRGAGACGLLGTVDALALRGQKLREFGGQRRQGGCGAHSLGSLMACPLTAASSAR